MQSECVPVAKSMFSARGAKALIKQPNEGTKERTNECERERRRRRGRTTRRRRRRDDPPCDMTCALHCTALPAHSLSAGVIFPSRVSLSLVCCPSRSRSRAVVSLSCARTSSASFSPTTTAASALLTNLGNEEREGVIDASDSSGARLHFHLIPTPRVALT